MSVWVLLTRGYLNALPSKIRNVLGGRISGIEEYIPLITRIFSKQSPAKIRSKLENILKENNQNMSDVDSAYYKALAEVSNFGSRTILDMFTGGGLTEISTKELPLTQMNLLAKIKFFRQLNKDAQVFDAFSDKKKELYEEMVKHPKESQEYSNYQTKIALLEYQQNITEEQLQDRLNLIQNTPEISALYEDYKNLLETNNTAFIYNVTSDIATKLYKQHMKNEFVDKRMEFVNRDEGLLRTATFEIAFVEEFERSHDFNRSLVYSQNAVKRQHAFYTSLTRVFAHGKASGRVLNTLRHYTHNKMVVLSRILKDTKDVKQLYGWKVLFKSIFKRDIRINGDEVIIFGKQGKVAQYSPANRLANLIGFNLFLYNLSGIIPGLQFVGNPVVMALLGFTDVIMRSFDPDDDDKPEKLDVFFALAQFLQLRGGVGKNFAYNAVIQALTYDDDQGLWDITRMYAPASARQVVKIYNLLDYMNGMRSSLVDLYAINRTMGITFGFQHMDFNRDIPLINPLIDIPKRALVPFAVTLRRLSTSPISRQIEKQLRKGNTQNILSGVQDELSELRKNKRNKFNILAPFARGTLFK